MAEDMEDDRQDAISEGCLEQLMKKNRVQGPWRVRGGSVEGPSGDCPGGIRGPALDYV